MTPGPPSAAPRSTAPRSTAPSSAAHQYKDILAEVTTAAAELRERDRARSAFIDRSLPELHDQMLRTGERARLTAAIATLHWERALDLLWSESWLDLRPRPAPDPCVDPEDLEVYEAEMDDCADALARAVRRRW
jgi:hypothetical protein